MKKILPAVFVFLSCGLNQGPKNDKLCLPGAASAALAEAEKSSKNGLREAVGNDPVLSALYEKRAWEPLLFSSHYMNDYGRLVLTIIENRVFDGFMPDPRADSALVAIARADSLRLSVCKLTDQRDMIPIYQRCLSELARAEVFLVRAWKDWAEEMGGDTESIYQLFADPLAASLNIEPRCEDYRIIRSTISVYMLLPDWKPLSFSLDRGQKIMPGDTGARVKEVQERLRAEGFYAGPITGIYDSATTEAIKTFQKWHYLEEDGVIGWGTVRAMNVSRKELIARLGDGLAYWRKTPVTGAVKTGGWVFRINIPEFYLYVYKEGVLLQKNKVAVGATDRDTNFTPTLRDTIEFIVINPKWNVPDRIFEEEILEEIYKTGDALGYIEKKKMNVASNKKGKIWLVRDPGEGNALGRVKFMFPNRHNIYLHDTPVKSTFALKTRTVSHGCIRLDGAIQLAIDVLTQNEGWTEKGFYAALGKTGKENGKTVHKETWVPLRQRIPIFIDYVLVTVDPGAGRATFLQDIYNKSGKRAR